MLPWLPLQISHTYVHLKSLIMHGRYKGVYTLFLILAESTQTVKYFATMIITLVFALFVYIPSSDALGKQTHEEKQFPSLVSM